MLGRQPFHSGEDSGCKRRWPFKPRRRQLEWRLSAHKKDRFRTATQPIMMVITKRATTVIGQLREKDIASSLLILVFNHSFPSSDQTPALFLLWYKTSLQTLIQNNSRAGARSPLLPLTQWVAWAGSTKLRVKQPVPASHSKVRNGVPP